MLGAITVNWQAVMREVCHGFNTMPTLRTRENNVSRAWWFCFGTMLTFVRNRGQFKKLDDVDVGVSFDTFEWLYMENFCRSRGYAVDRKIVDDVSGKPMYMSFKPMGAATELTGEWFLDVFAWRLYKDFYWHTYDTEMEYPKNGVPKRYKFKGVPRELFEAGFAEQENVAGSCMSGWIPLRYGSLLDLWYPDWLHERQECSHDKYVLECKSCKSFLTGKFDVEVLE